MKRLSLLLFFLVGIAMALTGPVTAQTFTTIHTFSGGNNGESPMGNLVLSSNRLYGTTDNGGSDGDGMIFAVNMDGSGFTNLYSFTADSDAFNPQAGLVLSGNILYGTTDDGGSSDGGTVFSINTDGSGYTQIYSTDGHPGADLVLSSNTLYGTIGSGGDHGVGAVFKVNTDGTGYTNLHSFDFNSEGDGPYSGLVISGNTLYGVAFSGGSLTQGSIFAVNKDGTGFTNLYTFSRDSCGTNSDGKNPAGDLILSGDTLYGTASEGGPWGEGTVFKVNTDGTGFSTLYSFTSLADFTGTNTDGVMPLSGLILSGDTLYGTTSEGGSHEVGTAFAINTNGTGFTTLHNFQFRFGDTPQASLLLSSNLLFGTTAGHGGTLFSIDLMGLGPPLSIVQSENNVMLSWPTNAVGFKLQFATNLIPPVVWTTALTSFTVVSTNDDEIFTNIVSVQRFTNTITGPQMFFRLSL